MVVCGGTGRRRYQPGRKDPEGDRIERYRKTPAAPGPDFG